MSAIRAATILTVWGAGFRAGTVSADELLSQLSDTGFTAGVRADNPDVADRTGLPGPGSAGSGSIGLLSLLREGGAPALVLPVAGDLRGLPPGSAALVPALDAGAAVILPDSELVIVPSDGVWRVHGPSGSAAGSPLGPAVERTGTHRPHGEHAPSILEAELALDDAIRSATKRLMALDISRDSARVRDQIADRMRADTIPLPLGTHRSASALLAKVVSLQALLAVAAHYETGAASRYELGAVDDALRPLAAAVRSGRLAAVALASSPKMISRPGSAVGRQHHSDHPAYE